jgi:hypothetical protein
MYESHAFALPKVFGGVSGSAVQGDEKIEENLKVENKKIFWIQHGKCCNGPEDMKMAKNLLVNPWFNSC